MPTYTVFLRAVNVPPRWIKMQTLRTALLTRGFNDVETYIQSGNVRLRTPMRSVAKVSSVVEALILDEFGFDVPAILRTPRELRSIATFADSLPSPFTGEDPRRYVTFCAKPITPGPAEAISGWDVQGERLHVHGDEVHWFLTKPAHTATMTNVRLEKLVGTATTRDLKVVLALADKWGP